MVGPWVMNSMYSHQERSQGWAKQVSEESSGWYAHKLVKQAVTTVSERELWLEKSKLTWYHSEWEEIVGSGCTSYITYTSEYFCELDALAEVMIGDLEGLAWEEGMSRQKLYSWS